MSQFIGEREPKKRKGIMSERWVPRCPQCSESTLVLAPADKITVGVLSSVHVYCTHCQWDGRLSDEIKRIYVRL
jgi:hypothetical protein